MRTLRNLLDCVLGSAVWPVYFGLGAYVARQAPWPRSAAVPVAAVLGLLALAALAVNLIRWLFGPAGWAENVMELPEVVTRQVRRAMLTLVAAHVLILLPAWLMSTGLITSGGRPLPAPAQHAHVFGICNASCLCHLTGLL